MHNVLKAKAVADTTSQRLPSQDVDSSEKLIISATIGNAYLEGVTTRIAPPEAVGDLYARFRRARRRAALHNVR